MSFLFKLRYLRTVILILFNLKYILKKRILLLRNKNRKTWQFCNLKTLSVFHFIRCAFSGNIFRVEFLYYAHLPMETNLGMDFHPEQTSVMITFLVFKWCILVCVWRSPSNGFCCFSSKRSSMCYKRCWICYVCLHV